VRYFLALQKKSAIELMAFYDSDTGKLIAGQRLVGSKMAKGNDIEDAVKEAVQRCQNKKYGSPLNELKKLFSTYPQMKRDVWSVGEHPCSPLIDLYTKELFS